MGRGGAGEGGKSVESRRKLRFYLIFVDDASNHGLSQRLLKALEFGLVLPFLLKAIAAGVRGQRDVTARGKERVVRHFILCIHLDTN